MNEATRLCADCGADISGRHHNAKRCESCAAVKQVEIQKNRVRAPRSARPMVRNDRIVECVVCGKTIVTNAGRRTCSTRCYQWNAKNPGKPIATERQCEGCGGMFRVWHQAARYCSRRCSSAASKRRTRDIASPYVRRETCATCNGPMPASKKAGSLYCSPDCGDGRDGLIKAQRRAEIAALPERMCVICGEHFQPRRVEAVTCSRPCGRRRDVELNSSNWNHKRRARLNASPDSVGVSPRDWARELRRMAGACFYCGDVSPKLTMDHVVPVSRGGRHALGNVVPACRRCNASKHDDTVMEWRRRLSRRKKPAA